MAENDLIALPWGTYTRAQVAACLEWMNDERGKPFFEFITAGRNDVRDRSKRLNPPKTGEGYIHPDYFRMFREQDIAQEAAYDNVLGVGTEMAEILKDAGGD